MAVVVAEADSICRITVLLVAGRNIVVCPHFSFVNEREVLFICHAYSDALTAVSQTATRG